MSASNLFAAGRTCLEARGQLLIRVQIDMRLPALQHSINLQARGLIPCSSLQPFRPSRKPIQQQLNKTARPRKRPSPKLDPEADPDPKSSSAEALALGYCFCRLRRKLSRGVLDERQAQGQAQDSAPCVALKLQDHIHCGAAHALLGFTWSCDPAQAVHTQRATAGHHHLQCARCCPDGNEVGSPAGSGSLCPVLGGPPARP